jgi:hypothetical protein
MSSITTSSQPTKQATTTQTVPSQPWRPISSVERDLAPWLKQQLYGKRSNQNGTFSGRGK